MHIQETRTQSIHTHTEPQQTQQHTRARMPHAQQPHTCTLGARAYILQVSERVEDAGGDSDKGVVVEPQIPVRHKKARYQSRSLSLHMPMNVAMRVCIGMHSYPHYEYVDVTFKGYMHILHV